MAINEERQWQVVNDLNFTRISGTAEEKKAAEMIKANIESCGGSAVIEPFEVDGQTVKTATLITEKGEYEVTAYYQCVNTPEGGLTAPFHYLSSLDSPVALQRCEGKIVLVNGLLRLTTFEKLLKAKAVGFITFDGELRDESTDLKHKELRGPLRERGNLPGVHMTVQSAKELVLENPATVTINVKQDTYMISSQNVIAEIKGESKPDEVIVFTAHYDSVEYTGGVYDNGSGSAILTELYRYFSENKPARTLRFIWCGSEERGLLGSKAYCKDHANELEKIVLDINVDCAGPILGTDYATVTGPESCVHYIAYMAKEVGAEIISRQDINSSDCVPFNDNGIPSVSFMRYGNNGVSYMHTKDDALYFMDSHSLKRTAEFIAYFTKRVANAYCFPIPREMPQNMVDKLDVYLAKKKNNK